MPTQVFSTAVAAADTTATFDFGDEFYERAYLIRGTMTTAAQFGMQGSADGTNFFKVLFPQAATATTNTLSFVISSNVTDCMVPIPIPSRYVRFIATGAACSTVSMSVVVHRNP